MKSKEAYLEQAEARLKKWRAEIERLKGEAAQAQAKAEPKLRDLVNTVYTGLDRAEERIKAFDESSDEAAAVLRDGVENALDELEDAVKEARSKFSQN